MEILLFWLLVYTAMAKNGITDVIDAARGRTPARYVRAQKRAEASVARSKARAAKYQARTGRPPKRSTVRPYVRTLFHDTVEDMLARHNDRRTAKAAAVDSSGPRVRSSRPAHVPAPSVRPRTRPVVSDGPAPSPAPAGEESNAEAVTPTSGPDVESEPATESEAEQVASVTPIHTEGITPMTAPTTEVTGVSSAITWAEQTGSECSEAVTTVGRLAAFFNSNEFAELGGKAAQMQEKFSSIASDCEDIVSDLQQFLAVKEQWAAVDNQGTKEAIVNE